MSKPEDDAPSPITDDLTRPTPGVPQDVGRVIAAARTLELHGHPSIAQAALGIARSKIGEKEPDRKQHRNTGPIVDWCLEGMTEDDAGPWAEWCAFFACQCVRRALIAAGADAVTLREWRHLASGSCSRLWRKLERRELAVRHVIGTPPPEGVYFVFYANLGKQGEYLYHDDGRPDLKHVGIVDRVSGELLHDVSGNTTATCDRVAEGRHMLNDPRVWGFGLLPYDQPGK